MAAVWIYLFMKMLIYEEVLRETNYQRAQKKI